LNKLKRRIKKLHCDKFITESKSWYTGVGVVVSDESFRAVVTLFFFGIIFSSSWAGDTIFSVPEWKVRRADTLFCFLLVDHLSPVDHLAFTFVVGGVNDSWSVTFGKVASLSGVVVKGVLWTRLASLVDSVVNVWSGAPHAVVENFVKSSWTA
jgi:hypothetical protein